MEIKGIGSIGRAAYSGGAKGDAFALKAQRASKLADAQASNESNGVFQLKQSGSILDQSAALLSRIGELAVKAQDSTLTQGDRLALNAEASELSKGLSTTLGKAQYNSRDILEGQSVGSSLDLGAPAKDGDGSAILSALTTVDLSSEASASATLSSVQDALTALGHEQAAVGAAQQTLTRNIIAAENEAANLAAASAPSDADVLKDLAAMKRYNTQTQINFSVQKAQQELDKQTFKFLK